MKLVPGLPCTRIIIMSYQRAISPDLATFCRFNSKGTKYLRKISFEELLQTHSRPKTPAIFWLKSRLFKLQYICGGDFLMLSPSSSHLQKYFSFVINYFLIVNWIPNAYLAHYCTHI